MKFYKSREWRWLRGVALHRDNYECQLCKRVGKHTRADCVHHLQEVRKVPLLSLTLDNLQSLCNKCHNKVHDRMEDKMKHQGKRFTNEERW